MENEDVKKVVGELMVNCKVAQILRSVAFNLEKRNKEETDRKKIAIRRHVANKLLDAVIGENDVEYKVMSQLEAWGE